MTLGKCVHAAQNVKQSGFTGAGRSDDNTNFTFFYFK